ncbi:hypothetical protein O181_118129, partial [Austropuccinia psidii MF-1]|nr:hypothetical protein [Austropuccinia psidii MF-1]
MPYSTTENQHPKLWQVRTRTPWQTRQHPHHQKMTTNNSHQGESRVNRWRLTSHSSPPDHPATVRWLVKITQDPRVCTNTHQRGPSASLDVGGGFDFTRSSIKGLRLSRIVVLQ